MKKTVLIGLAGISLLMSACSEPETQAAEVAWCAEQNDNADYSNVCL